MNTCPHDNSHANPAIVSQITFTNDREILCRRQCALCNRTDEQARPLPDNFEAQGIDAFFDWDQGIWQPVSEHAAYQARQQAKLAQPPATK